MALIPLIASAAEVRERYTPVDGPRILKLWHLASVDAPTVAVAWASALAWAAHVRPAPGMVVTLALAVWAIYVVDRLLDARTGLRSRELHPLRERHYFHWRHRRMLGGLALAAVAGAAWLVLPRLGASALRPDSAVAMATLIYFGGVHGGRGSARRVLRRVGAVISRECVVGIIFTAGCTLPALTAAVGVRDLMALAGPVCALAVLACLNVRAIACWEADEPRRKGMTRAALTVAGLALVGAAVLMRVEARAAGLLVMAAASAALLALLDRKRDRLEAVTLRAAADLVLLTPLVLLGWPGR
ncbi:MAG TPA: hypothetical protein VG267_22020 [Terracidiphilus sp.]|nr:hypothetical protein [Terracidiphilus sp.]